MTKPHPGRSARDLLTDSKVRNAKPTDKPYKLRDGGGLFLLVLPSGKRLWRLRYGHGATESMAGLGDYDSGRGVSLAEARDKAAQMRKQLADGVTPVAAKKAEVLAEAHTFKVIAAEWMEKRLRGKNGRPPSPLTKSKAEWIFGLLGPDIGKTPVKDLTPPQILQALRKIEVKGNIETAHRAKMRVSQVMQYAIAAGYAVSDPARDLRGALPPVVIKHHASVKKPTEVAGLLRAIDGYDGQPVTAAALKLAPLVFVRPGELRAAEWSEFHLDGTEPTWRIPAPKMKMKQEHIVPLSTQAVAILRELQPFTGRGRYLFPSVRTADRPMSNNTVNSALRRLGYTGEEMTGHGFRSMASTLLNEKGFNRDWIERQLAHVESNNVREAYNAAEYLPQRRKMMQAWATYLDGLKADDKKVVAIRRPVS